MTIHIPLPPKAVAQNDRCHWAKRASAVRIYRGDAFVCARAARMIHTSWLERWGTVPVVVSAEFYCGKRILCDGLYRPLDIGNAIGALKPAIDGLVDAGLIPDDSHRWLSWGSVRLYRTKKEHKGRCEVVLTIEIRETG